MTHQEYEFVHYRPEYRPQVIELMQYLWGNDADRNELYFKWKHEDNPCIESPLGHVALYSGDVVGFRSLFALRFGVTGQRKSIIVLSPGDTCVHPDHRLRGLFMSLGRLQMKEYSDRHRIFLSTTITKNSLPGSRKLGYIPISQRVQLVRSSLPGFAKYALTARERSPLERSRIRMGRYGGILVSGRARSEDMAQLAGDDEPGRSRLRLVQDEAFFDWRYRNPRGRYAFYYSMDGDVANGYVVVKVSRNNRRGYILDYAEGDGQAIRRILGYIVEAKHFDVLSIYSYGVSDHLWQILHDLGFRRNSPVRFVQRRFRGEMPLLIRPVKEDYADQDFYIHGLDIRRIENWSLKPIVDSAV